eukprot:Polyplicarium_translucidae@DN5229_c0_g1_i1.p1
MKCGSDKLEVGRNSAPDELLDGGRRLVLEVEDFGFPLVLCPVSSMVYGQLDTRVRDALVAGLRQVLQRHPKLQQVLLSTFTSSTSDDSNDGPDSLSRTLANHDFASPGSYAVRILHVLSTDTFQHVCRTTGELSSAMPIAREYFEQLWYSANFIHDVMHNNADVQMAALHLPVGLGQHGRLMDVITPDIAALCSAAAVSVSSASTEGACALPCTLR